MTLVLKSMTTSIISLSRRLTMGVPERPYLQMCSWLSKAILSGIIGVPPPACFPLSVLLVSHLGPLPSNTGWPFCGPVTCGKVNTCNWCFKFTSKDTRGRTRCQLIEPWASLKIILPPIYSLSFTIKIILWFLLSNQRVEKNKTKHPMAWISFTLKA